MLCPAAQDSCCLGGGATLSERRVLHILKSLLMDVRSKGREKNSTRLEKLPGSAVGKWAAAVFAITKAGAFFFFFKYVVGNKEYDPGEAPCIPLPTLIKISFFTLYRGFQWQENVSLCFAFFLSARRQEPVLLPFFILYTLICYTYYLLPTK